MLLAETQPVILLTLNTAQPFVEDCFAEAFLQAVGNPTPPPRQSALTFVETTLASMKGQPPLVVVEVDTRCTSSQLQSEWGPRPLNVKTNGNFSTLHYNVK